MRVQAGDYAPDFALTHRIGQPPVRLSDLRGTPVVLLFFPLAFSGMCTDEICSVADDHSRWKEVGAEVLGISVDSGWVTAKFEAETGAPFRILSDFNKTAARDYGVLNDDFFGMNGVADRSVFVIDGEGKVAYAWTSEDADIMPPFDEALAAVRGTRG